MYSAGLRSGRFWLPKKPQTTTATSASVPIVPPAPRGQGVRATAVSHADARRGYWIALAPTCSPPNITTSTNEMTTTKPAARK